MQRGAYDEIAAAFDGATLTQTFAARRELRKKAEEGDAASLAFLGTCLLHGTHGFLRSSRRGTSLIIGAARLGEPHACEEAGDLSRLGRHGGRVDEARARELYMLAAQGRLPKASGWLAWFEWYGIGGPQDREASVGHARCAVAGGDLNGYRIGALIQANGVGVPRDTLLAITILREVLLREAEDPFALCELGRLLCDPEGVYQGYVSKTANSEREGARLIRQAASMGYQEAVKLSTMLPSGHSGKS